MDRAFRTKCINCGALEHVYFAQNPDMVKRMSCGECGKTGTMQKLMVPPGVQWDGEEEGEDV